MSSYYLLFFVAVVIAAFGQIALKKGAMGELSFWRQYTNPYVGLGYLLLLVSMGMASVAYREIPLKAGPIMDSIGFILVPVLSKIFFKERITTMKLFGFSLILVGIAVFSL